MANKNWSIGVCDDCSNEDIYVYVMYDKNLCGWCATTELNEYDFYEKYEDMVSYENCRRNKRF